MIRVTVLFPPTDWPSIPDIRAAARGLSDVAGLLEMRIATKKEPAPGATLGGPVAEISFRTGDSMREALSSTTWGRFLGSGGGAAPTVQAYALAEVALFARGGARRGTTDVDVAAEEASGGAEPDPLSAEMVLPLSRPPIADLDPPPKEAA